MPVKIKALTWDRYRKKSFENSKGVARSRKSKDRQDNGQRNEDKRTNNDLQNTTQKTIDRATRTPLKTGGELCCSGRVSSSCSTSDTRRPTVKLKRHEHHLIWKSCWTPVYVNKYK
jgi:hypothetical protein